MRLRVPFATPDADITASGEFVTDVVGSSAADAARVLRLADHARRGARLEVWIAGKRRWAMDSHHAETFPEPSRYVRELISDMLVLEGHFGIALEIPERMSQRDRAELRRCRQLLEGKCILEPTFSGFTVTLNGSTDAVLEDMLRRDTVGMKIECPLVYEVCGHRLKLPNVALFHLALTVDDGDAVIEELRAGTAHGREVAFRRTDELPFRAYLPDLVLGDDSPLIASPLEVEGLPEHPAQAQFVARSP